MVCGSAMNEVQVLKYRGLVAQSRSNGDRHLGSLLTIDERYKARRLSNFELERHSTKLLLLERRG